MAGDVDLGDFVMLRVFEHELDAQLTLIVAVMADVELIIAAMLLPFNNLVEFAHFFLINFLTFFKRSSITKGFKT